MKTKADYYQTKSAKTKMKLYETATALFEQYNFNDVTVDSIVEAAGVSKGTFYIHFESKDQLIISFLSEYVHNIDSDYKAHLDSLPTDSTSSDMLLSLIGKVADVLTDVIGYSRMQKIYKIQLMNTVDMDAVKGYNRELYSIFAFVLNRGIQQGEFYTESTLEILTKHFVMAIRGLSYEWCIRYPNFDLKEESVAHFRLLLNGIQK